MPSRFAAPARRSRRPPPNERGPQQLREAIEEEIATGRLQPGIKLDESELAARFGVSRTPVREALRLLVGEGLLENRPHRGSVVARVTPQRLVEMFEVMAELESMCARLAARRMTDDELAALESAHEACRAATRIADSDAYFYANEGFHFAIYAGAHNAFLAEQATSLQRKLRPYRRLQLRVRDRVRRSFDEHQGIVDALRAGDGAAAAERLRRHVVVQNERFADLMASLTRIDAEPAGGPTQGTDVRRGRSRAGRLAGPAAKAVFESAFESVPEPAFEPAFELVREPGSKPVSKPVTKPASRSASRSAPRPAPKPASKPIAKRASTSASTTVVKRASEPVARAAVEPAPARPARGAQPTPALKSRSRSTG